MILKKIYGWEGFELSQGDLKVGLTPTIGGRIMSLKFKDQELLFVDPKHTAETFNLQQWSNPTEAKKALGFRVWGGDKTWIAPQSNWLEGIPPLDLDAAPYSFQWQDQQAIMTSPVCRETGVQIIRRVGFKEGNLHLIEEVHNKTSKLLQVGLWNVTQVKRPCRFEIPSLASAFRSYHHEDKSLPAYQGDLSSSEHLLKVSCNDASLFKVGGIPSKGELSIFIPARLKEICFKKTFSFVSEANYAHQSAVEVFNSSQYPYAEIELHSPYVVLMPNEWVDLTQVWCVK